MLGKDVISICRKIDTEGNAICSIMMTIQIDDDCAESMQSDRDARRKTKQKGLVDNVNRTNQWYHSMQKLPQRSPTIGNNTEG